MSAAVADFDQIPSADLDLQRHCLLCQLGSDWHVLVGDEHETVPVKSSEQEIAETVRDALGRSGVQDARCVIALATTECFFTAFDVAEVVDAKDRAAMTFELERIFPLDAEAMGKAVAMQFQRTLGRSPRDDELARFVALMEKNVKEAGRVAVLYSRPASISCVKASSDMPLLGSDTKARTSRTNNS